MKKEILGVKAPKETCTDKKCPFHGSINVKPETFKGRVVRKDTNHSATIEWLRSYSVPKYERFEMHRSKLRVHNPPCINASLGQEVIVARTRPLSKTKNHVIISITESKKTVRLTEEDETKSKKKKPSKKEDKTEVRENNDEQNQQIEQNESDKK